MFSLSKHLFLLPLTHSLFEHYCPPRYTMFWLLLLAAKLLVSYYLEVLLVTIFTSVIYDM
jgi:hypothetical protein